MKRLVVWYLPQAAFFALGAWPWDGEPVKPMAAIVVGLMFAAAYSGGANLVISLVARLRAYRRKPDSKHAGLSPGAGLLGERTENADRIGIDKQLR